MTDDLRNVLRKAIASQSRTSPARVLSVSDGFITAFSELYGNIQVPYRGNDHVQAGARILVRRSGPEKYAQYVYDGFASDATGSAVSAGIRPGTPIQINPISDQVAPGPAGTLEHTLHEVLREIRLIKGTSNWDDLVSTSLRDLLTWCSPVEASAYLPLTENSEGDVRLVKATNELWVWSGAEWKLISGGEGSSTSIGSSTVQTVVLDTGSESIPALSGVCVLDDGAYRASAANPAHHSHVMGISTHAAGAYSAIEVAINGVVTFPDYTFASMGAYVLGTDGKLRPTYEPEAKFVQRMGVAISHSRFVVSPGRSIKRAVS